MEGRPFMLPKFRALEVVMRKTSLKITITFHEDGTVEVLVEWDKPQYRLRVGDSPVLGRLLDERHANSIFFLLHCITVVILGAPSMKADKGQFDTVLARMLAQKPIKTADIKATKRPTKPEPKPDQK